GPVQPKSGYVHPKGSPTQNKAQNMKKSFPWSISALLMFSCAETVCAKDVSVPLDPLTQKVAHIAEEIYAQGLYPGISIAASGPNEERVLYQIGHADVANDRRVTTETVF